MAYESSGPDRRMELIDVIGRVRNRWRLKLALRGAVIVVAGTLTALLLSASSLEALRFSPTASRSWCSEPWSGLAWCCLCDGA